MNANYQVLFNTKKMKPYNARIHRTWPFPFESWLILSFLSLRLDFLSVVHIEIYNFCMTLWWPMRQWPTTTECCHLCANHSIRTRSVVLNLICDIETRIIKFNEKLIFFPLAAAASRMKTKMTATVIAASIGQSTVVILSLNCCKFIVNCEFCPRLGWSEAYYHILNFILKPTTATIHCVKCSFLTFAWMSLVF